MVRGWRLGACGAALVALATGCGGGAKVTAVDASFGGAPGPGGASGRGGSSGGTGTGGGAGNPGTGGAAGGAVDASASDVGDAGAVADGSATSGTTYVYVSGNSSTIRVYRLDRASGSLLPASMTADGGNHPSYLAFHPNKKTLYALNENGANSRIIAFSIGSDGALTKLASNGEVATTPGQGPPHLSVHPSGKFVYAAHYGSGHTTVHPILGNGGIGPPASNDKTATNEAHQAFVGSDGKFLFVPCRTPNYVAQYRIDETTGLLTANNPARAVAPLAGTGPRHMDIHGNNRWAYVLGELNGNVISYNYDGATGLLSDPQMLVIRAGEDAAAHILVHPEGRFLFASLRRNNEIATLAIDQQTGRLTVTAHQTSMISGPRDFTVEPTGTYLLVANTGTGTVVVFQIAAGEGTLTFRSSVATSGITQPEFVGALVLP